MFTLVLRAANSGLSLFSSSLQLFRVRLQSLSWFWRFDSFGSVLLLEKAIFLIFVRQSISGKYQNIEIRSFKIPRFLKQVYFVNPDSFIM